MAKVQHQGGAVAEVSDDYADSLVATGEWEIVGGSKPAPVRRVRKAAVKAADPKPEGALASE